jgi:hypothetical protein
MTAPHVVHNVKTGCMECTHCGFQQAVKMPIPVNEMLTTMNTFLAHHGACAAPDPETVMSEYIKGFDAGYEYVLQEIERWKEEVGQDLDVLLAHLRIESTKGRVK